MTLVMLAISHFLSSWHCITCPQLPPLTLRFTNHDLAEILAWPSCPGIFEQHIACAF
jgi:hypothetical protein